MNDIPSIPPGSTQTPTTAASTTTGEASSSLRLPSTPVLPQLAKDISIGDTVQFLVRGKTPEGLGVLYMMGQLVQAKIPEHVNIGDKVRAQIGLEGQQIIFKILDVISKGGSQINTSQDLTFDNPVKIFMSLPDTIKAKVEEALYKIIPFLPNANLEVQEQLPNNTAPFPGTAAVAINKELQDLHELMSASFPNEAQLMNGTQLSAALQKLTSSGTTEALKEIQKQLSTLLQQLSPSTESRFLTTLQTQINTLASNFIAGTTSAELTMQNLDKIIRALSQEINNGTHSSTGEKSAYLDTLKITLSQLKDLAGKPDKLTPESFSKTLQFLHSQEVAMTGTQISNSAQAQLPAALHRELRTLLTSIEQFTATQELLQRLEPILQSLRQPELILFPFIFQGLFSFGEIIIDPDAHRRQKKQQEHEADEKNKPEDNDSKRNIQGTLLQYHAQIPLPNLGNVQIASLQSKNEIELKLHFQDKEKAEFIREHLTDLRTELQALGFSKMEIQSESDQETAIVPEVPIVVR